MTALAMKAHLIGFGIALLLGGPFFFGLRRAGPAGRVCCSATVTLCASSRGVQSARRGHHG